MQERQALGHVHADDPLLHRDQWWIPPLPEEAVVQRSTRHELRDDEQQWWLNTGSDEAHQPRVAESPKCVYLFPHLLEVSDAAKLFDGHLLAVPASAVDLRRAPGTEGRPNRELLWPDQLVPPDRQRVARGQRRRPVAGDAGAGTGASRPLHHSLAAGGAAPREVLLPPRRRRRGAAAVGLLLLLLLLRRWELPGTLRSPAQRGGGAGPGHAVHGGA
mmetsp:Transcript_61423/g.173206  ORF Transcript_61423/g.173206 Transcript_61423/m.173206 type:complete len:217 (-) Transcript_61423:2397-3047(-)